LYENLQILLGALLIKIDFLARMRTQDGRRQSKPNRKIKFLLLMFQNRFEHGIITSTIPVPQSPGHCCLPQMSLRISPLIWMLSRLLFLNLTRTAHSIEAQLAICIISRVAS